MAESNAIILFEERKIRHIEHNGERWFSVVDIIELLADSPQPSSYWNKIKNSILKDNQSLPFWQRLNLPRPNGRNYPTDCANTEGVLRIIQSVPSPKAEPFKLWLAGLGKQAIEETNDPELLTERQVELYRAKGYSEQWIANRLKTIEIRKELTDEWQKRGVTEGADYSILTATIAKGTFGLTPSEHSEHKGLGKENLRDHMTRMELILTALSEEATRTITVKNDAQGFPESHEAALKGGEVGKRARLNFEEITGEKVISNANFIEKTESQTLLEGKTGDNTEG